MIPPIASSLYNRHPPSTGLIERLTNHCRREPKDHRRHLLGLATGPAEIRPTEPGQRPTTRLSGLPAVLWARSCGLHISVIGVSIKLVTTATTRTAEAKDIRHGVQPALANGMAILLAPPMLLGF
jgi:hypothetical protein